MMRHLWISAPASMVSAVKHLHYHVYDARLVKAASKVYVEIAQKDRIKIRKDSMIIYSLTINHRASWSPRVDSIILGYAVECIKIQQCHYKNNIKIEARLWYRHSAIYRKNWYRNKHKAIDKRLRTWIRLAINSSNIDFSNHMVCHERHNGNSHN